MVTVPGVWYNGIPPLYHTKGTTHTHQKIKTIHIVTADLYYYDAATQILGVFPPPQVPYFTMQLGCMRFLEYMGFVFSFELWLHHSAKGIIYGLGKQKNLL